MAPVDIGLMRYEYRTPPGEDPTAAAARFEAELNRIASQNLNSHYREWHAVWRLVAMRAQDAATAGSPWAWGRAQREARKLVHAQDARRANR